MLRSACLLALGLLTAATFAPDASADPGGKKPGAEAGQKGKPGQGRPGARGEGRRGKPGAGQPGQRGGKPGERGGKERFEAMLKKFDKNGDQAFGKDELPERMWQFLGRADANGDNKVTGEELKAAREKRMAEGGRRRGPRGEGKPGADGKPGAGRFGKPGEGNGKPGRKRPDAE